MHLTPSEARTLPIVTGAAPAGPAAWRRSAVSSRLWPAAVLTAGGLRRLATRCSARGPLWVIKGRARPRLLATAVPSIAEDPARSERSAEAAPTVLRRVAPKTTRASAAPSLAISISGSIIGIRSDCVRANSFLLLSGEGSGHDPRW